MSSEKEKSLHEKSLGKIDEFKLCQIAHARTSEEHTNRLEEMRNCNHLYLKLGYKEPFHSDNSSDYLPGEDIVVCVHCGLTNRFKLYDEKATLSPLDWKAGYYIQGTSAETIAYNEIPTKGRRFISQKELNTTQAQFLFNIAKEISPNGSGEEIREIMGELDSLEEFAEKRSFGDDEFAATLKERYYAKKREQIENCQHFLFYLGKTSSDIEGRRYSIYECPYCGLCYEDGERDISKSEDPFEKAIDEYNLYSVWKLFSDKSITSMEYEDKTFRRSVEKIIADNIKTLISSVSQNDIPEIVNNIIALYATKIKLQGSENVSPNEKLGLLESSFQEYFSQYKRVNGYSVHSPIKLNKPHITKVKVRRVPVINGIKTNN